MTGAGTRVVRRAASGAADATEGGTPAGGAPWRIADTALVQAGSRGERWLAAARVRLVAALWLIPLSWLFTGEVPGWELHVGLAVASGALAVAALLAWAVRRSELPRAFGLASGVVDVTLVSAGLAAFLLVGQPLAAVNSLVLFQVYYLALAATALRYDWRVCALAGAAAVAEYAGLAAYAAARWQLTGAGAAAAAAGGYGTFAWSGVVGRAVTLGLAAALAAAIVARAGRLRTDSVRDRLTGLANRAYFDERLSEECARARRAGQPLSLALLDLDHFKRVNDAHGHLAGDAVLRAVAGVLRAHVRGYDVLARYGGEEFALLLVETDAEGAVRRAEALRRALEGLAVAVPGVVPGGAAGAAPREAADAAAGVDLAGPLGVTASAGVASAAEVPPDGPDGDEVALVHLADGRLYAAKALGRNRVVGPARSTAA